MSQSIKRGKNVEAVQIGPNQWGMRPVVDEDVAKVVSINGHQSGQTQQARRAHRGHFLSGMAPGRSSTCPEIA